MVKNSLFLNHFLCVRRERKGEKIHNKRKIADKIDYIFRIGFCSLVLPVYSFFLIPMSQKMPSSLSATAQREGLFSQPSPHPPSYPPPSLQSSLNPLPPFTAMPSSPWTARVCFPHVLICRWALPLDPHPWIYSNCTDFPRDKVTFTANELGEEQHPWWPSILLKSQLNT